MDLSPAHVTSFAPSTHNERWDGLAWLVRRLDREGISLAPGSRIHEYLSVLEPASLAKVDLSAVGGSAPLTRLHIANCEGGELHDIAKGLLQPTPVPGWAEQLRQASYGPFAAHGALPLEMLPGSASTAAEQPQMVDDVARLGSLEVLAQLVGRRIGGQDGLIDEADDTEGSTTSFDRARTKQFELFLATEARRRGCEVEFEEPDVIFRKGSHVVGIAAKRISSLKQLERRVREATEQIVRSRHRGMIAVDLTAAMDLHRKVFVINSLDEHSELHAALGAAVHACASGIGPLVRRQEGCERVVGMTAYGRMMVFARKERAFITHRSAQSGPANGPSHPDFLFLKKYLTGSL